MGLVHDDHLIFVQWALQVLLVGVRTLFVPELPVSGQLLKGEAFHEELILGQKTPPRTVAQRRRTDQQRALAPVPIDLKDLATDECLPETHFVGNDDAAGLTDQPEGARDAVFLKTRQRQIVIDLGLFLDLLPVELPQNPDEDVPGRPGLEHDLEDLSQIVGSASSQRSSNHCVASSTMGRSNRPRFSSRLCVRPAPVRLDEPAMIPSGFPGRLSTGVKM